MGHFQVIGKPRVSERRDSQMSRDRQHIGTLLHPEASDALIKSPGKAQRGAVKDKEWRGK